MQNFSALCPATKWPFQKKYIYKNAGTSPLHPFAGARFNARRGGVNPSCIFLIDSNDSKYRRKTFSTLSRINLMSSNKISEKSVEKVLRKWCFSDVMFHYFRWKSGKCLKASRMYRFEVSRNPKTPKDIKLRSTKWLSQIFYFSVLTWKLKMSIFKNKCR